MNTELPYVTLKCSFTFSRPTLIDNFPTFVLRSVLGNELKRIHCVMRGEKCDSCPFWKTCAYSFIFENPINKDTQSLPGRDRSSHPFRLWTEAIPGSITRNLTFFIQLFGRAVEYIPHITYSFREAGLKGLFGARVPATLTSIIDSDQELLDGNRVVISKSHLRRLVWDSSVSGIEQRSASIYCITPMRFKSSGKYRLDFDGRSFLDACRRRTFTLLEMYGEKNDGHDSNITGFEGEEQSDLVKVSALRWVDFTHYSRRQGGSMILGGMMGSFTLEGYAPCSAWSVLDFCTTVGTGKNTSFGYGAIKVEYGPGKGGMANG